MFCLFFVCFFLSMASVELSACFYINMQCVDMQRKKCKNTRNNVIFYFFLLIFVHLVRHSSDLLLCTKLQDIPDYFSSFLQPFYREKLPSLVRNTALWWMLDIIIDLNVQTDIISGLALKIHC